MPLNARRLAARTAATAACSAIPAFLAGIATASVPALSWGLVAYGAVALLGGVAVYIETCDAGEPTEYELTVPRLPLPAPNPELAARLAADYADATDRVIVLP